MGNPNVDANGVVAVDNSASGAAYKGLAIDTVSQQIYAANFTKNQVEIYDNAFHQVKTFTDTALPKHFAPFNVTVLKGNVYVAFAKRIPHSIDEVDRRGLGYVDVFDTSGTLMKRLIANGQLDAPWGMTIAPKGFGQFVGALLVGNFGNGKINAYDVKTGDLMGTLHGAHGDLHIDGLWALDAGPTRMSASRRDRMMKATACSASSNPKVLIDTGFSLPGAVVPGRFCRSESRLEHRLVVGSVRRVAVATN